MAVEKDLDLGMKCIKYMLCVANLMFVLVGMLLISIGYTIKTVYRNFEEFMEDHYYNPSTLAIIVGFFIFLLAMFGCIGAVKESTFLVNTYAFFLALVLILEISVSIAAYSMRSNIEDTITLNMQDAMEGYNIEYNAFTWNATQYNLQCCGIHNYTDWQAYAGIDGYPLYDITTHNSTLSVPETCCVDENCTTGHLYKSGCLDRLSFIVSQCALLLAVGALCVSFIQVLGIVFASMLAKSIRKIKTQMLVEKEERRRQFYEEVLKNEMEKPKVTTILYTPADSEA